MQRAAGRGEEHPTPGEPSTDRSSNAFERHVNAPLWCGALQRLVNLALRLSR